jgi:hypothetical protein
VVRRGISFGLGCALAACLIVTPVASADSRGTITKLQLSGTPTAGVPLEFDIDATLANPADGSYVMAAVEPAGAGCPSGPADLIYSNGEDPSSNPFPIHATNEPSYSRGSYILCGWLANPSNGADIFDSKSVAFTVVEGGTISLTFAPTPADEVPLIVTATGTGGAATRAWFSYKPAGAGAACADAPEQDSGTLLDFRYGGSAGDGSVTPGNYSVFDDGTEIPAGSYLVCSWLARGDQVIGSSSQNLTVAPFDGTISLPDPFTITTREQAKLRVDFHLNAPRRLWVTLEPSGTTCAPSFGDEQHGEDPVTYPGFTGIGIGSHTVAGTTNVVSRNLVPDGSATVDLSPIMTSFTGALVPGRYHVCAWLAGDDQGKNTDFGPVATTVTVPGSGATTAIPGIQGYEWHFNSAHALTLTVFLQDKATIEVTLYRATGHRRHRIATLRFKGHAGKNVLRIRRWRGQRLGRGHFAISMRTRVGRRRSQAVTFKFTL